MTSLRKQREAVDADLAGQRLGGVACVRFVATARRNRRTAQS
jgi:hypothetical protein